MSDEKLQPEPTVIHGGKVSDASEHLPTLNNPQASRMADELAIREAVESGIFTEEEARRLMSGPEDLSSFQRDASGSSRCVDADSPHDTTAPSDVDV